MIFPRYNLIFLHVQKTGGNSLTHALLPYSADRILTRRHQDGWERFGVAGETTPRKHATLAQYQAILGDQLDRYRVAISVRDPLERAVSMYFSPHKWMVATDAGWRAEPPYWSLERFAELIADMRRIVDFLTLDDEVRRPDHVLRFETLVGDLQALAAAVGLPLEPSAMPHVNKSAAPIDLRARALADPEIGALVRDRFAADYAFLAELDAADRDHAYAV